MRLLCVLVVVGVAGGVPKEQWRADLEKQVACGREEDEKLCLEGFFFTATALKGVGRDGVLEVALTLEESLHPHVTFDLSLHKNAGDKDFGDRLWTLQEEEWKNEEVLVRKQVTLEVNELRRVELRVSDLAWSTAYLVVTAYPTGNPEIRKLRYVRIKRLSSDADVFVQTAKVGHSPGENVDFRAVLVDWNVDKSPKFAQVVGRRGRGEEETRLPWTEVPPSGILRGNFAFNGHTLISASVTSDVTSGVPTATSPHRRIFQIRTPIGSSSQLMSVRLEGLSDVYFSQPKLRGRVTLTSAEGRPLDANCSVTIQPDLMELGVRFTNKLAERRVAVGVAGGEFEFDVGEELGAERRGADLQTCLDEEGVWGISMDRAEFQVKATCTHLPTGTVEYATDRISMWRSLHTVDLLSVGFRPKANSSHPESTVVLKFLVGRRDGGSVEEEEPTKGLQVKLLLTTWDPQNNRYSATDFSLPIPRDGVVRLRSQIYFLSSLAHYKVRMEVGDAAERASLAKCAVRLAPNIHVTPVDPVRLIRRGDVVRFRVRSCAPYGNLNAILSSHKAIYSSQRFSFTPQGEGGQLDEVIELRVPQNVTEGSLNLLLYGLSTNPHTRLKAAGRASIKVNLVPSSGPQEIQIVDQVEVDMSTVVTFRLDGMLEESVVSLQAAKLESVAGAAEERKQEKRPLGCQIEEFRGNREIGVRDDSPVSVGPEDIAMLQNIVDEHSLVTSEYDILRHPRPSLLFFEVDRKTSTEDNGTLTLTKSFDRLTEFGTYVVSGATFNSKSGRTVFSNSPVLRILPPPVTLSIFVSPSVVLGETLEVLGYVKNNLATPFEGHVTWHTSGGGSKEVKEEHVEIQPSSVKLLKMQVTPVEFGDFVVSLQSNISSRLTATKKVKVNPPN